MRASATAVWVWHAKKNQQRGGAVVGKGIASVMALLVASIGSSPPVYLRDVANVAFMFVLLDTIAGIWCAFISRQARSRTAVSMLVSKSLQYLILLSLCTGAAMMADSWFWVIGGLQCIIGIEALSLIETAIKLQRYGVQFPAPVRAFLERIGKYLAVAQEIVPPIDEKKDG